MNGNSFERFSSFDALYDASYKICRNVRWKDSTIDFEASRLERILETQEALRDGSYEQKVFSCFTTVERGKQRDIRACHIDDRLVQNALCEEVLLPNIVPMFIYDNCATLKNRGIDFALDRVKQHLRKAYNAYGKTTFYAMRIDIKKYFDSINHEALKRAARKAIQDDKIYELVAYFIDTFNFILTKDAEPVEGKTYYKVRYGRYKPITRITKFSPNKKYYECIDKSLGLGSQTSQLLALLALNDTDHYIKERLHIKFYGRYIDDLYLFHNDKTYLQECMTKIEEKLAEIGLSLNRKKSCIHKIQPLPENGNRRDVQPFKYLKWNFYVTSTGGVLQLPFKKKIAQQRRRLRKMAARVAEGRMTIDDVLLSYAGWRTHMAKGNTFYIIQDMDNYFHSLFKGVVIT